MAHNLRKADIVRVLRDANVDFDPEGTVVQLRPLYDQVLANLGPAATVNNDIPAAQDNLNDEQRPEAQVQNQQQQQLQHDNPDANHVQQERPAAPNEMNNVQQQNQQNNQQQNIQGNVGDANEPWARQMAQEEAEIERQLALLRKKRELIQLQKELNELESRKIDLHVLDAMMSKFDGSDLHDVKKWLNDLENVFEVFKYSDRDHLVAARHLMTGHAKRFTDIISVRTYGELKRALTNEFQRAFTVQDVIGQLRARTMKSGETPRQYVIEMQYIANRADISETDLIDIIIEGLNDKSTLVSMLYGATTIQQLKVLMERYEKKRRVLVPVPSVYANTRSVGAIPKIKPAVVSTVSTAASNSASVDMSTIRCYNCFAYGHYQGACTAPKRPRGSCFICSEVGHTRHNCPRKKKPDESTSAVAAAIQLAKEEEVRRLAAQLKHQNWVSVAFYEQNKCTELISRSALFDSGSPVGTIQKSYVPFVNDDRILTKFKGMGNKQLSMCGFVKCKFVFREHELMHDFLILPDEEAAVPLLVGRDLLRRMNIHLCQISSNKYSCQKILDINKESKTQCPNEKVVSALKLFNLFKKPNHSDTEVPVVRKQTEANNLKLDPEVN